MKLLQLLNIYSEFLVGESQDAEVTSICMDSRKVSPGSLFVAISGSQTDGHRFIEMAIKKGAVALVVESSELVPKTYSGAIVKVGDAKRALTKLCAKFYGYPANDFFCVGVTGTNGKTSITYLIEHILNQFNWKTGVLGTIDHHIGDKHWSSQLTTPDAITLQKRLREMHDLGAKAVAFEVSSHAIEQNRVYGVPFNGAVFTNLTRDHLDYHNSMESYFLTKQTLFRELLVDSSKPHKFSIINIDDPYGQKIKSTPLVKTIYYGQGAKSDYRFKISKMDFSGSHFVLQTPFGEASAFLSMPGLFSVYNAVAAVAVALQAGLSLKLALDSLESFKGVPGRLEFVENKKGLHIFIDYAHTDDALMSVLKTLSDIRKQSGQGGQIHVVFGCGGDRDRGKRPLMMKAALAGADKVIVTSDNPRTEGPQQIIDEILSNTPKDLLNSKVFMDVDRKSAIQSALSRAQQGDIILIAGKGHENYQIIGTEQRPFSDAQAVREILKA